MPNKQEQFGRDLKLKFDQKGADLITAQGDFEIVTDEDNLAQAIIARLSTDEGELDDIGHADYGSRLHDVIGEVNNAITRQKIKAIVMNCLVQEDRIKEVAGVNVETSPDDPHRVEIEITIIPIAGRSFLTLLYPFRLEG